MSHDVPNWLIPSDAPYIERVRHVVGILDTTNTDDPEAAHGLADDLVLSLAPQEVKDAYRRLVQRCPWWACA